MKKQTIKEEIDTRKIKRPNFLYVILGYIWKIIYFKKLKVNVKYKYNPFLKHD